MSSRKDPLPKPPPAGGKRAHSPPARATDDHSTTPRSSSSTTSNNRDMHMSLEDIAEGELRGSTDPTAYLTEANELTSREQMITLDEFGNPARYEAVLFPKDHPPGYADRRANVSVIRPTHSPMNTLIVESGIHRNAGAPYGSTSSLPPQVINNREQNIPHDITSHRPVEFAEQAEDNDKQGSTNSDSVEIKLNYTASKSINPKSEKFGRQKNHGTTHVTSNPKSDKLGRQKSQRTTHVTTNPESEIFGRQKKKRTTHVTTNPESHEFGRPENHSFEHGAISESDQFGLEKKHPTSRLSHASVGSRRNITNLLANNIPSSTEFNTQINDARQNKPSTGNIGPTSTATEAKYVNRGCDHITSASAAVSEQNDDSSSSKTDGRAMSVGEKSSSSNFGDDDDKESRELFRCKICLSDRIQRWMSISCGHLMCVCCKQKITTCPFCRTPIREFMKIRFAFDE